MCVCVHCVCVRAHCVFVCIVCVCVCASALFVWALCVFVCAHCVCVRAHCVCLSVCVCVCVNPCCQRVLYCRIFPESSRWLVAQGRLREAEVVFRRIAAINGRDFPENLDLTPLAEVRRRVPGEVTHGRGPVGQSLRGFCFQGCEMEPSGPDALRPGLFGGWVPVGMVSMGVTRGEAQWYAGSFNVWMQMSLPFSMQTLENYEKEAENKPARTALDLFKSSLVRKWTLVIYFYW